MVQTPAHFPSEVSGDEAAVSVSFQPTFEEMVDVTIHAAQHLQARGRTKPRPGRLRLAISYVVVLFGVMALAFTFPDLTRTVAPTFGIVAFLVIASMTWTGLTTRRRYRKLLTPLAARLERAGVLTITLTGDGLETVDGGSRSFVSWRACDSVIDTGHSVIIFMGAHAMAAPYRAFGSGEEVQAFFAAAKTYQADAEARIATASP